MDTVDKPVLVCSVCGSEQIEPASIQPGIDHRPIGLCLACRMAAMGAYRRAGKVTQKLVPLMPRAEYRPREKRQDAKPADLWGSLSAEEQRRLAQTPVR